jgi:hypothetical protein
MPRTIEDVQHAMRARLIDALGGANAHQPFAVLVRDIPAEARDRRPPGAAHSPWEVLEHMRLTLWDILEFSRDPKHVSPQFPSGYWPLSGSTSAGGAWEKSVDAFERDLQAMKDLVADPQRDLFEKVDHPDAQPHHTLAREAMVVVDHNGYHLGEMVLLRRLLGVWPGG